MLYLPDQQDTLHPPHELHTSTGRRNWLYEPVSRLFNLLELQQAVAIVRRQESRRRGRVRHSSLFLDNSRQDDFKTMFSVLEEPFGYDGSLFLSLDMQRKDLDDKPYSIDLPTAHLLLTARIGNRRLTQEEDDRLQHVSAAG